MGLINLRWPQRFYRTGVKACLAYGRITPRPILPTSPSPNHQNNRYENNNYGAVYRDRSHSGCAAKDAQLYHYQTRGMGHSKFGWRELCHGYLQRIEGFDHEEELRQLQVRLCGIP